VALQESLFVNYYLFFQQNAKSTFSWMHTSWISEYSSEHVFNCSSKTWLMQFSEYYYLRKTKKIYASQYSCLLRKWSLSGCHTTESSRS
jgi:hypothetical protein